MRGISMRLWALVLAFEATSLGKTTLPSALLGARDPYLAKLSAIWGHVTPLERVARQSLHDTDNAEVEAEAIGMAAVAAATANEMTAAAFIGLEETAVNTADGMLTSSRDGGASPWVKAGKARKDPCKAGKSDTKFSPYEIKTQGKEIADGDKLRRYDTPCEPPPWLHLEKLMPPGLPTIPIAPPIEMPPPFLSDGGPDENPVFASNNFGGADKLAYQAAMSALRRL